jgi:hypothetical protein
MNKPSKKTKEWITNFTGKTFSSNEQVIEFLYSFAEAIRDEAIEECIRLAQVHTEKNGRYCDTGGDMDWGCRSECVDMAISRLQSLKEPKH